MNENAKRMNELASAHFHAHGVSMSPETKRLLAFLSQEPETIQRLIQKIKALDPTFAPNKNGEYLGIDILNAADKLGIIFADTGT